MAKRVAQMGGTTAQVAAYVGIAKQIIIDTSTWRVHLMDGVNAGGIRLARFDEIPSLSAYMKTADAQNAFLAKDGTAVKATSDANGNNIVNTYGTKDEVNDRIPVTGNRGAVAGYESTASVSSATTITESSADNIIVENGAAITIANGTTGRAYTKVLWIVSSATTITLGTKWKWPGDKAPTLTDGCMVTARWNGVAGRVVFTE